MHDLEYVRTKKELLLQAIKKDNCWKGKTIKNIGIGKHNGQYCIVMAVETTDGLPTSIDDIGIQYKPIFTINKLKR